MRRRRRLRRAAFWLGGLTLAGGFYLVLIDTVDRPELYAGAGAATLAAFVFEASREQGLAGVAISPRWPLAGWRVLMRVPVDLVVVSGMALMQLASSRRRRGGFAVVSFRAGGERPRDAGRRALAEALGSLAPNTIVIGVDTERDVLLAHKLSDRGGRDALDPLRLG